jgi:hypothetical protein
MNIGSFSIFILMVNLSFFAIGTIYRMWVNSKILRIKYNYERPGYYVGKDFSSKELDKEQEAGFFILFCFFTFFWYPLKRKEYGNLRFKSNMLFLLTLISIVLTIFLLRPIYL